MNRPARKPEPESELRGIQVLATELGITTRAIRFYEDKGLIEPQRIGTTRVYTKREFGRMQLILRGKRLGFSLREIKEFLDLYDADPDHIEQMRSLQAKVAHRVADLETQAHALEQTLAELRTIEAQVAEWVAGHGG
jgi:DNA-binding transcriptional MerR regulator